MTEEECSICGEISECMGVRIVDDDGRLIYTAYVCKDECYEKLIENFQIGVKSND